ncbi:hypothetical protein QJS10_CPB19g00115 [Acorus calamus]|uniref:Uncharacterized protein n=1 Tax=Acorus calamus TaxID=4465 RepID=A0AAV9CHJ2_ACOCL|nr:hypothetical protein QJS10_CPB19g00115 [Acorus calamus]
MGCGGSKVDDLPLVTMCRDRRRLIRAAADLRYDFAAAHSSYFRSLPSVGSALHRFVIEELSISAASSSSSPPPPSPVLTLPSDEGKSKSASSSSSLSHLPSSGEGSGHLDLSSEASSPAHQSSASPYEYYNGGFTTAIPSVVYARSRAASPETETFEWSTNPVYYYNGGGGGASPPPEARPAVPPPPPPAAEGSAWDFLNPFGAYEEMYNGFSQVRFGGASSEISSPDSSEVRRREGIPNLEEEEEIVSDAHIDLGGSGESSSKVVDADVLEEKQRKGSSESRKSGSPATAGEEESVRKKGVSFEVEPSVAEATEFTRDSSLTALPTHGTRDVLEVVKEIKQRFESACDCGAEVSAMLEAGKLPYHCRGGVLGGGNLFQDLGFIGPFFVDIFSLRAEELTDEEKMRVSYERKCKQLKILDDRGAESTKIEAIQASITKLLTKLSITIKSIDAISRRIHKLRDEELQPQLSELVEGLIRMWKSMLDCHQKQFQAIIESKNHRIMAKTMMRGDSKPKATMEFESELLDWCSHFNCWIATQKSYIEALNGWLRKCLFHEPEVTADGEVPFSPGKLGAPAVFIICNDWCTAMERISEDEVKRSMHAFADNLRRLWEIQDEEQRQRLKAEYLSRDFKRRLDSLHVNGVNGDASVKTAVSVVSNSETSVDDHVSALDMMRKRRDEERAKHVETIKHVHEAASGSLRTGLIPIFDALNNFSSEALKAYGEVRIPTKVENTS